MLIVGAFGDGVLIGGVGGGVDPVPGTRNVCGLPTPVLTMRIELLRAPAATGMNAMATVHVALLVNTAQFELVILNSAGAWLVTLDTVTASAPMLRSVTEMPALESPTKVAGNVTLAGC